MGYREITLCETERENERERMRERERERKRERERERERERVGFEQLKCAKLTKTNAVKCRVSTFTEIDTR